MRAASLAFLVLAAMAACQATPTGTPAPTATPAVTLTPYTFRGPPPTRTATPTPARTATPLPTPTATPYLYTILEGDTLLAVAFKFGLTLEELLAANPGIDPQFLRIGDPLIIPPVEGQAVSAAVPTPVGEAAPVLPPQCWPAADDSLWCFWLFENQGSPGIESLAAQFTLLDADGTVIDVRQGIVPLNLLQSGARLPVAVWFPAGAARWSEVNATVTTAFPAAQSGARITALDVEFEAVITGTSAWVTGSTAEADGALESIRLAIVAYDAGGQVVGLRIVELVNGDGLVGAVDFEELVYSLGGEIAAVEILAEAYLAVPPEE